MAAVGLTLLTTLALVAALVAAPTPAHATVMRYALVVGTNVGRDAAGAARPALRHAEREARQLHKALIARAGFSERRTRVLAAPTRAELLAAIASFRAIIAQDRRDYAKFEALFVLYFSGHGVRESLLLVDGPLGARELAAASDAVGADLELRIVDACASGSLADALLVTKGMTPVTSLDLPATLPDATLNAKGDMWLLSSAAHEVAFEHEEYGGLFTHALIEALSRAHPDEHGISLNAVWEYVRRRTSELAAAEGHVQTPEKISLDMRETGPLYLAWLPLPRATLVLGPEIAGALAVKYGGTQLVTLDKVGGETLEAEVFAGVVDVVLAKGDGAPLIQRLELAPGARVFVRPSSGARPRTVFGRALVPARAKGGAALGGTAAASAVVEADHPTVFVGASYRFDGSPQVVLAPSSTVSLSLRLDVGPWLLRVDVGYGVDRQDFPKLSYDVQALMGAVQLAYGFDLGRLRLSPFAAFYGGQVWQRFDSGARREAPLLGVTAGLLGAWPLTPWLAVEVGVGAGGRETVGAGIVSPHQWSAVLSAEVGLAVRL